MECRSNSENWRLAMSIQLWINNQKPRKRYGVISVEGEIQINDFKEYLYIPLDWWSIDDYTTQWKEAVERLKNYDRSCFVATIHNPNIRKYIEWWPMYKIGNQIHIQNNIILDDFYDELIGEKPFTIKTCYDFIPKYRSHSEEGYKLSEWVVDWDDKLNKVS